MRLVIAGPSGVGKSTVGGRLASDLGLWCFDSDTALGDPASIIREHGEVVFREREAALLSRIPPDAQIVVLGGGSLQSPSVGARFLGWERIVLMAGVPSLLRRIGDGAGRPLLAGDVAGRTARLLAERSPAWRGFGIWLHTDDLGIDAVVARVKEVWCPRSV